MLDPSKGKHRVVKDDLTKKKITACFISACLVLALIIGLVAGLRARSEPEPEEGGVELNSLVDEILPDEEFAGGIGSTCHVEEVGLLGDGVCDSGPYITHACGWDNGDCLVESFPACHVDKPHFIANGVCDGGNYNSAKCGWDGGDCILFNHQYPNCLVGYPSFVGNGQCNGGKYNTEPCGWDGGDCSTVWNCVHEQCIMDEDQNVPCIAVLDEDYDFEVKTCGDQFACWSLFRAQYPKRPFCLVGVGRSLIDAPQNFLEDPNAIYVRNVPTDCRPGENSEGCSEEEPGRDWLSLCGFNDVVASVSYIGVFVDISGSLMYRDVQFSLDRLERRLHANGVNITAVHNEDENWIAPFLTTLVRESGNYEKLTQMCEGKSCESKEVCAAGYCVKRGSPRFTLTWYGDDDYDLSVLTPDGFFIGNEAYNNGGSAKDPATGGFLESDTIPNDVGGNVENIAFPNGGPADTGGPAGDTGIYQVSVKLFHSVGNSEDKWKLEIFDPDLRYTMKRAGSFGPYSYRKPPAGV